MNAAEKNKKQREIDRERYKVGQWIQTMMPYDGVPKFTEGVVVEHYDSGVSIAWDRPHNPVPKNKGCSEIAAMSIMDTKRPLVDGFSYDEVSILVVIQGRLKELL